MRFKAFIRVVKFATREDEKEFFCDNQVLAEKIIEADNKEQVKEFLSKKYPQFFQNGKVYERKTRDKAQFFYAVIYPLFNWEEQLIEKGEWICDCCGHVHENMYVSKPDKNERLLPGKLFCKSDDQHCLEIFKKEKYSDVEIKDDLFYIKADSPVYIYKITEKKTGKSYIGKTRNEPFFRWWNHYSKSQTPFGKYLKETSIVDWTFEVIEILPHNIDEKEVFKVESKYMIEFDTIKNGFNTVISNKGVIEEELKKILTSNSLFEDE